MYAISVSQAVWYLGHQSWSKIYSLPPQGVYIHKTHTLILSHLVAPILFLFLRVSVSLLLCFFLLSMFTLTICYFSPISTDVDGVVVVADVDDDDDDDDVVVVVVVVVDLILDSSDVVVFVLVVDDGKTSRLPP